MQKILRKNTPFRNQDFLFVQSLFSKKTVSNRLAVTFKKPLEAVAEIKSNKVNELKENIPKIRQRKQSENSILPSFKRIARRYRSTNKKRPNELIRVYPRICPLSVMKMNVNVINPKVNAPQITKKLFIEEPKGKGNIENRYSHSIKHIKLEPFKFNKEVLCSIELPNKTKKRILNDKLEFNEDLGEVMLARVYN